jgi:acetoin utilization protein AcuB
MEVLAESVKDVMTFRVCSAQVGTSLKDAAKQMHKHGIRHMPVLEGERLVGILSDRDVLIVSSLDDAGKVVVPEMAVEDCATKHPISCRSDTTIKKVAETLIKHRIDCLPVISGSKRVVGIITSTDIMSILTDARFKPEDELPATFELLDYRNYVGMGRAMGQGFE